MPSRILRHSLLALAFAFASLSGASAAEKPKIVASFSILGDMTQTIGGDRIDLVTLVGPNGDAHVYEPSPKDARAVAEADVLIVNGLAFEGWMPRLIDASGFKGRLVTATEGLTPLSFEDGDEHAHDEHDDHDAHAEHDDHDEHGAHDEHEGMEEHGRHHHGAFDPHAWQSLENGRIYVENITRALVEADPAGAETYKANAAAYLAQIAATDADLKARFAALAPERRRVVTSHDAFGYFAAAYGLTFVAPQGVATDAEASARDVARLIDQIRAEKITAVFVENVTDTRLIERIASETGAKVGGTLYSDALSDASGPAPTYLKMFEHNSSQLLAAMAGS